MSGSRGGGEEATSKRCSEQVNAEERTNQQRDLVPSPSLPSSSPIPSRICISLPLIFPPSTFLTAWRRLHTSLYIRDTKLAAFATHEGWIRYGKVR